MTRPEDVDSRAAQRLRMHADIGPIGLASRVAGGTLAIAVPIALDGFDWWEAAIAFIVLPLIVAAAAPLITAAFRRLAPDVLQSGHPICSAPSCSLIAVVVAANAGVVSLTPANGNVTIWVWLGASMLLAAARGYGGCEVLALSNVFTGRRDEIGCILYTPVDRWEAKQRLGSASSPEVR